jgi:hypothetical protein
MTLAASLRRGAPDMGRRRRFAAFRAGFPEVGGVVAGVMAFAACASGQDALLSALSIDRAIAPPQNRTGLATPDQSHFGPFQLSSGLSTGAEFNDNIYGSQTAPRADVISHAGANLALAWGATGQALLQFGAGIGYAHYFKNSENGGLEVTPNSALSYRVNFTDGNLALFDQVSYWRQVVQEPALVNVATLPRLDNTAGLRVAWEPGRWELQAGYSHDDYLSTSSSFEYLNRSSEYVFMRDGWRFAAATQAGLEASGGLTRYEQSLQSDDRNLSLGLYSEWQVTKAIRATIRGGATDYFFGAPRSGTPQSSTNGFSYGAPGQVYYLYYGPASYGPASYGPASYGPAYPGPAASATPSSTLGSYYLGLDVSHQLNDFFAQSISLRRDVTLGLDPGSDYVDQLATTYSFSWSLRQCFTLGGQVEYLRGSQPLAFFASEQEHFSFYGGGPTLGWRLTRKLAGSLNYSRWQRTSDLPGRNYTQNIVSLHLTYAFR